jgi:hypothetical protein
MDEIDASGWMPMWHPMQNGCHIGFNNLDFNPHCLSLNFDDFLILKHLKFNHDIKFFFILFKVMFNHMLHFFIDNNFFGMIYEHLCDYFHLKDATNDFLELFELCFHIA